MEHLKDMQPEEVYNLFWEDKEEVVIPGDIQEEVQESDFSNLPRTVERIIKDDTLNHDRVYKRYIMMDNSAKEYRTEERIKTYHLSKDLPEDEYETQKARMDLWDKYRDAEGIQKAFLWFQLDIDREHLQDTEMFDKSRYDLRAHIKKHWAEVNNHTCNRCGGTIYRNIERHNRIIDPISEKTITTEPFGEYGEFRCVDCLTSLWYCEDCAGFHTTMQKACGLPCVGTSMTNLHIGDLVIHNRDRGIMRTEEEEAQEKAFGFFDPTFDPYGLGEERIQNDPLLKALYAEMMEKGGETVFKYAHTRLNQWLTQAERIRQKKTGLRTLDIHNYAYAPQRDHAMTQLEKDLFKLEINAFRMSRGEYRTGTKIFVKSKTSDRIERGTVYCSGYYTLSPKKLEELEEAQVGACA